MYDYAELNAPQMASMLAYLATLSEVPTGSLSNVVDVLDGWNAHFPVLSPAYDNFREAYQAYRQSAEAWHLITTAAWNLGLLFQRIGEADPPFCQTRTRHGRVCGRPLRITHDCSDPANHTA